MYIYLDESGDLGFDFNKKGASKYFVITLLVCENQKTKKALSKAVKRTLKNKINHKKKSKKQMQELKGTRTSLAVKKYFFRQIDKDDYKIYSVILNKKRVYEKFWTKAGQNKIYNFLAKFVIEKIPLSGVKTNVRLVVDKCKNRVEIVDFNNYIRTYIEGTLDLNTELRVEHLTSHEDCCLQAVDMFCWGVARKYKDNDRGWYDIFKEKMAYDKVYLP